MIAGLSPDYPLEIFAVTYLRNLTIIIKVRTVKLTLVQLAAS